MKPNIPIDKKLLVPITMLAIVLAAGSVYAITSFQNVVTVNVVEPISVNPSTTTINNAFAGSSQPYQVQICNKANFAIPVTFSAQVGSAPSGGNPADISLRLTQADGATPLPSPITVPPASDPSGGCTTVLVTVSIGSQAAAGAYSITNTVTKAA